MDKDKNIKLSIVVAVYNHEKYIAQAINSILEQQTNFEYEVLIGEDCSTDTSRTILQTIERNCYDNFHFFYRDTNYGSERNFQDLYSRMKGDYFIVLEGDDYWCYPYKLQKQVEFLDSHPEYVECSHLVSVVDEESRELNIAYPECNDHEYTLQHFRKGILPGQTAANMYRNYYKNQVIDFSLEKVPFFAGDRRKAFIVASQAKVYCIQQKWSSYRYVVQSGSSFSATHKENIKTVDNAIAFYKAMLLFSKKIQNDTAVQIAEELYYLTYLSKIKVQFKCKDVLVFIQEISRCNNKLSVFKYIIKKGKL